MSPSVSNREVVSIFQVLLHPFDYPDKIQLLDDSFVDYIEKLRIFTKKENKYRFYTAIKFNRKLTILKQKSNKLYLFIFKKFINLIVTVIRILWIHCKYVILSIASKTFEDTIIEMF